MKKTEKCNIEISNHIGAVLGISFKNEEYALGKWGEVDNWSQLYDDTLILIECEKGQKHPNTNVLKLYPYLEENPGIKIILVHYFYPGNKAPKNRISLCDFLGKKMEQQFFERFKYISLRCNVNELAEKLEGGRKGFDATVVERTVRLKVS